MTATDDLTTTSTLSREREDLLETLGMHRWLLQFTVQGLTDEQARLRPTASELSLGGLVKHVSLMEEQWADFIVNGADAMQGEDGRTEYADGFTMGEDETLEGVLAHYAQVAEKTEQLVRTLPDLDADHELPPAPWFEPGKRWSARRVLVHLVAETAQHAGHADILRESLDGQKSMG